MKLDEKTIRVERAKVWDGMAQLIEDARKEDRSLTADERTDYDARSVKLGELDKDLERLVQYDKLAAASAEVADTRGVSGDEAKDRRDKELRAFTQYLKRGVSGIDTALKPYFQTRAVYDAGMNEAGFQSTGTAGGFMVPQGFWENLQIALKAYGGLLNRANVVRTATGNPMDWPTVDPTGVVGAIIGEGTIDGFQDYTFGQGVLQAWTYTSKVILASVELVNDAAFDVDSFVRDRVGEAIGRALAAHLVTGTGTGQPLGIQTALAARGVVAGQSGGVYQPAPGKVGVLGNPAPAANNKLTSALIGFDDILAMTAKVDPAYRASGRCAFVGNDATVQQIRSVTDQYGHPLWSPNVAVAGGADQLYGYDVQTDNNQPNYSTVASTVGGLLFGDFQTALVVRMVDQADVLRLTERYADARQVGYYGFVRADARSNDLRAAVVIESPTA